MDLCFIINLLFLLGFVPQNYIIYNEVFDQCFSSLRWMTVTMNGIYGVKAAVRVQKTAHRILLYGFRRAEQELPQSRTNHREFSAPLLQATTTQLSQKATPEHLF